MTAVAAQYVAAPVFLNGYPVVKSTKHANVFTIMVAKPAPSAAKVAEFVVATWWPDLGTSWMWGHYFPAWDYNTLDEARAEADEAFAAAESRNAKR